MLSMAYSHASSFWGFLHSSSIKLTFQTQDDNTILFRQGECLFLTPTPIVVLGFYLSDTLCDISSFWGFLCFLNSYHKSMEGWFGLIPLTTSLSSFSLTTPVPGIDPQILTREMLHTCPHMCYIPSPLFTLYFEGRSH